MIDNHKIITLCGSTKFKDDFFEAQERLTLEGNIVISVGLFGHADKKYDTVITDEVKEMLDDLHKRKIDLSDEIYVINKNGYIGSSTKSEIEYALSHNKPVSLLESVYIYTLKDIKLYDETIEEIAIQEGKWDYLKDLKISKMMYKGELLV